MKALLCQISLLFCLIMLVACGNKGDLFLEPVELTAEQKALLEELEQDKKKKQSGQTPQSAQ
jgi:predicted small lipoprotein YifL